MTGLMHNISYKELSKFAHFRFLNGLHIYFSISMPISDKWNGNSLIKMGL